MSFREVARRAGVSHQAPYHHFGDHKGILQAIAKEGFSALANALAAAASSSGDPLDALTASGLAYVRFAQQHVGHFRVMFQHDLVDVFSDQQPLPEAERTFGVLMRVSQMAVHSGYGAGLTAIEIAHLCWSCVHGLANLLVEGVFDAQREAQRLGRADDRESSGDRGDEADARGQRSLSFEGNVVGRKIRRHHDGHRWRSAACRAERLRR